MRAGCGNRTRKVLLLIFMIAFLAALQMQSILFMRDVKASSTLPFDMSIVFVDPLNVTANVGDTFAVSVKIFNLSASFYIADEQWVDGEPLPPPGESYNYSLGYLYAFDIRLGWDPTILEYISHNVKTPVEDYPEGVLHEPTITVFDTVDAEEGTYMLVQVSTPPAAPFNAPNQNATLFTMTFNVKKHGKCPLNLTHHELAASPGLGQDGVSLQDDIPHWAKNGQFQTSELLTRIEKIGAGAEVAGELHDPAIQGEEVTLRVNMRNDGLVKDTYNLSLYDGTTLLKRWENETLEPDAAKTLSHTLTGPATGIHTVKAEAAILHESEARTDEMSKNFRVVYTPTLQISGPSFAAGGQTVSYNASGSLHNDPNGQIQSYTWTLWGPGETLPRDTQTGVSANFTLSASATGAWTVMLAVEDNYGITAKPISGITLTPTSELSRPAAASYRMYVSLNVGERPIIILLHPENKTYTTSSVSLTFFVNEEVSWIGYSLDGNTNTTISGNSTLSDLANGSHTLVIYARDDAGNTWSSTILHFSVDTDTAESEPFSLEIVAAIVVIVIAAALGATYFIKLRRGKETKRS